jgi:hypothetical protein
LHPESQPSWPWQSSCLCSLCRKCCLLSCPENATFMSL